MKKTMKFGITPQKFLHIVRNLQKRYKFTKEGNFEPPVNEKLKYIQFFFTEVQKKDGGSFFNVQVLLPEGREEQKNYRGEPTDYFDIGGTVCNFLDAPQNQSSNAKNNANEGTDLPF